MDIRPDGWLSGIFGHPVFNIVLDHPEHVSKPEVATLRDAITQHARQQLAATYYSKVDTTRVDVLQPLHAAGLYVVDVNVTLGIDTHTARRAALELGTPQDVSIGDVQVSHEDAVLEIARSCFRYSRFHLDPCMPKRIADQVKHDWILSYIRKQRGEKLVGAFIADQPVGFLAVLATQTPGQEVRTIDLIGVSPNAQKRGVGQALGSYFVRHYHDLCDHLRVGTQIANVPSMHLYQKLGFTIRQSTYVMHMHV